METDQIDALIERCVIQGIVAGGSHLRKEDDKKIANKVCGKAPAKYPDPSANEWSREEIDFLRKNIGLMSMKEIGEHLGRTENAVKIKSVRHGFPTASRFPGYITTQKMARILRVDSHTISTLRKRGLIETQIANTRYRQVRIVSVKYIYRWATRPRNWLYFKAVRIMDPHLKRLVLRAQSLWEDEWWTPRQVADHWGISIAMVNLETNKGRLKGVRWGNWWYLKSEAIMHNFWNGTFVQFSSSADAWIMKARDELNMTYLAIAESMKRKESCETIRKRYKFLKNKVQSSSTELD